MKKLLIIILSILVLSSLVACENKAKEEINEDSKLKVELNEKLGAKSNPEPVENTAEPLEELNEDSNEGEEHEETLRHGFIEERIAWGSYEYDVFAILDEMGEGDLEYFNITESFVVSEKDFFGYVVILPVVDRIHVLAEEVEYDSAKSQFKVINKLWENDINFRESNLIQTSMSEGIPSLRLTITYDDMQIYWFNTYDGENGSGLKYYSETDGYTHFEWDINGYIGDVVDGYDALFQYDEIVYHMEQGMVLHHDENYAEIDGISCPIFVLSSEQEGHIVNEYFYAYDPVNEVVYVLDAVNNEWELLGFG